VPVLEVTELTVESGLKLIPRSAAPPSHSSYRCRRCSWNARQETVSPGASAATKIARSAFQNTCCFRRLLSSVIRTVNFHCVAQNAPPQPGNARPVDATGWGNIGRAINRIALLIPQTGEHPAPPVVSRLNDARGSCNRRPGGDHGLRRGRENTGLTLVVLNVNFPL
jgi:hypothetical protein